MVHRPFPLSVLAAVMVTATAPVHGQDLVGCQLIEGQLSCVPGVSTDPQQQIRALKQEISGTEALEGAVQQSIEGLASLTLAGEAATGALLTAAAEEQELASLPDAAFHWYRLPPGGSGWLLIEGASGPAYRLQAADAGALVMLVITLPGEEGDGSSRRQASPAVGPVRP
jgi:hypothetical protein